MSKKRRQFSVEQKTKIVLEEAIYKHGTPEILNSNQGSQYTSYRHTEMLKRHNIKISMNGIGALPTTSQLRDFSVL